MSVYASSAVWKMSNLGDPTRKLIMLAMADMANDELECWPSVRSLGKRCGISESSVRRHLEWLEKEGHIKSETRQRPNGSFTSNIYTLTTLSPVTVYPSAGDRVDPPAHGGVDPAAGATPMNHHSETSVEPKVESNARVAPLVELQIAIAAGLVRGFSEQEVTKWWENRGATGWVRPNGHGGTTPIKDWQLDMMSYINGVRERKRERAAEKEKEAEEKEERAALKRRRLQDTPMC